MIQFVYDLKAKLMSHIFITFSKEKHICPFCNKKMYFSSNGGMWHTISCLNKNCTFNYIKNYISNNCTREKFVIDSFYIERVFVNINSLLIYDKSYRFLGKINFDCDQKINKNTINLIKNYMIL